jgi:guanylate kinase
MPPTFGELRKRLLTRGTEGESEIERRVRRAYDEMRELPKYNYLVINDDIDKAISELRTIVAAEKLKPCRSECKIQHFYGNDIGVLKNID